MVHSSQSLPGTPTTYMSAPLFDITATHMPIITESAIIPIYKRQLSLYRKAHEPNMLTLDSTTNSLQLLLYPMLDEACTTPVPFGNFNNHHVTHQMPRFTCFCPLLGRPASSIKIICCTNGRQWHGWFLAVCDLYEPVQGHGGCGYFVRLGKADSGILSTDYFSRAGTVAPMHYYPPRSAPPSQPPMIYYPFIIPYVPQPFDNFSIIQPSLAGTSNTLSTWNLIEANSEPQTPKAKPKTLKRSSSEALVDQILQISSATSSQDATPDVFTQAEGLFASSKGTLFHRGYGGSLTGPLDSPAVVPDESLPKPAKRLATLSCRVVETEDSSALFHQQQARLGELKNIAILLRVLDPCSTGISRKDLSNCIWTCDICNRNFASWLQEEHTFVCIEKHTDIEVINNTPTKVINLTDC